MVHLIAGALLLLGATLAAQAPGASWLDRPLSNWNSPGRAMPQAMPDAETIAEIARRCGLLPILRSTPGERVVADAGWLPFHMFDRQIVQRDVEIVGGMAGADGMCRPMDFNIFVFVNGTLAGTLSPGDMASRSDGTTGAIRLAEDDTIAAEFARYDVPDPLCCPSARVRVRYRIDRTVTPPVVVPVSVQPTRR